MDELTAEISVVEELTVDRSSTVLYEHFEAEQRKPPKRKSKLKMPTLAELLASAFKHRKHLLHPWLREQESCMVYADTGVGKSLFALSAALAVAGGGEFLGWSPEEKADGHGWRVLYVDGEMHITDIQERAKVLLDAVAGIDRDKAAQNLQLLARQHQDPEAAFPSITEPAGTKFFLERIAAGKLDLVVLDNFSTLGEVEDENAASSFNAIQQFLLQLKVQGVATILVHHAKKNSGDKKGGERTGNNFRGSSKLAATFETIIELERIRPQAAYEGAAFRVRWDKVRMGGPQRTVRETVARLSQEFPEDDREGLVARWEHEAGALQLLDDLKEHLIEGQLTTQKEIGVLYGHTPTTARNWIDKGIKLGMWTEDEVSGWFAKGKRRRDGKTEAPVKPDYSWKDEALDDAPNNDAL
jgi:KaiC/GvpD/RAD55 family RecA-like ATPase